MTPENIIAWYKEWVKRTNRCGSVLITNSITDLFIDFNKMLNEKFNNPSTPVPSDRMWH